MTTPTLPLLSGMRITLFLFVCCSCILGLAGRPLAGVMNPVANPLAVVTAGNARFTVLTDYVIRCEWSASQTFQDAATWTFTNRNTTVPKFSVARNNTHIVIQTAVVSVTYQHTSDHSFATDNFVATTQWTVDGQTLRAQYSTVPNEEQTGNLLGTVRTLDGNNGDMELRCRFQTRDDLHCAYGVVSRGGYAVIDDTHRPIYDQSPRPWIVPRVFQPQQPTQCTMDPTLRRDCGFPGVTPQQCADRGCCHTNSTTNHVDQGIPTCFYGYQSDQDLYFFGHGNDYKTALSDFTLLSGPIPIPPRYIFGVFFSRYWAYASWEEIDIITQYAEHAVPLDTLVIDMDWHLTYYKQASEGVKDQAGQQIGWSGFTFNPLLFPNHTEFLQWCKLFGLKNTVNLHPASGIQPWEETYSAMATAMGIDPKTNRYVPFNATDAKFDHNWAAITLHPLTEAGIDLFWLDWQQGEDWINLPYVNPTFWLNYMFFTDPVHWSNGHRPALLHRWGGLGNGRYPVGFSGDVVPSWPSLTLQPYFTATAANVAYTYWSHDLGGHVAPTEPELYARWLQWGSFSPIFRTHCTKNVDNDRRIWTYPWPYYNVLKRFTKLRQSLVPYLYTSAHRTYLTSLAIVLPLYYEWPNADESYVYDHEYQFGADMIVSPVTVPVDTVTAVASSTHWIPPGSWINFFTGDVYAGPLVVTQNYTLDEMPTYARAGSIIPLLPDSTAPLGQAAIIPSTLRLIAFVGSAATGRGHVYEDDGDDAGYLMDRTMISQFSFTTTTDSLTLTISAAVGNGFASFPSSRGWEIHLRGAYPATAVTVNGAALTYELYSPLALSTGSGRPRSSNAYSYDGATLTVIIYIRTPLPTSADVVVNAVVPMIGQFDGTVGGFGLSGIFSRFVSAKALLDSQWGTSNTVYQDDYPHLLEVASLASLITYNPQSAITAISRVRSLNGIACSEARNITNEASNVRALLVQQLRCNTPLTMMMESQR